MFDSVATWETHPQRKPAVLTNLISKFPVPGEVVVNGEPILSHIEKDPDRIEEVLATAVQAALKSRSERDQVPTQPNSGVQLELQVRRRIRDLVQKRIAYYREKQCLEQALLAKDQTLEHLAAPVAQGATARSARFNDLIEQQSQLVESQDRLISLWFSFRADRLALYHDLGVLPFKDWKGFFADLKCSPVSGKG